MIRDTPLQARFPSADESRFRDVLQRLPAGAYTCDANGLITYFNEQAREMWGRAPKLNDPVDRYCGSFKLYSLDGIPLTHDQCWMALALRRDAAYNGQEIVIERPGGDRVTALAHANPIHDQAGILVGGVNVLVDISDRKRAEETQALLAGIVDSSEDAIISKTLGGEILTWNSGAERLFGYTAAEAIGQSIALIVPPERREEESGILARLRRGERVQHFETVRVSKHGRRIDISLSISPILDGHGRIVGASKVARDISERKQFQDTLVAMKDELASQLADLGRLQEMSVRLNTTLELQPILNETIRTAAELQGTDRGVISLCNDEHGLEVRASQGFNPEFLAAIAGDPAAGAGRTSLLERRRVVVEDIENDPSFASHRDAARKAEVRAVNSTPLISRTGKLIGVLSTHFRATHRPSARELHLVDLCVRQAVDAIENARLYHQLREADRSKNEFLAVLAHELRNPLAPIRNAAQILHLTHVPTPEFKSALDLIDRQMVQMTRLIDDLLDIARITGNKLELRRQTLKLADVLAAAAETCRPMIDERGQSLIVSVPAEAILLDADLTRLAQVVSNLLNNASKFTPANGQIWLTAVRQGSDAVISVRDTGLGIDPRALPDIFDMFAQGDHATCAPQSGLGIGLTLVKRLVEMHGGSVRASSDGPGKGSEFVVRIPMLMEKPTPASASSPRQEPASASNALRILVVDDNVDSASSLEILLRMMGHHVRSVHDGPEALTAAESFRPNVLLLDIGLPEMSGHEVARRIRQEPWGHLMTLIAMTGWGQPEDKRHSEEAGFDHHLVKPVDPASLLRVLATLRPAGSA